MGCRLAKSVLAPVGDGDGGVCSRPAPATVHQTSSSSSAVADASKSSVFASRLPDPLSMLMSPKQFKARLERLMCVARETPEPVFELSACDMRTVPAGVFILCKVLRKERLDLSGNRLRTLNDGGAITDLLLLTHLDLSGNAFKTLPDELVQLVNLQELNVQHNRLSHLPADLHQLRRLEFLDASHNRLQDIRPIACMPSLRVLNVSGNPLLQRLPMELSTCPALADIVCDDATVLDPPPHILERGTHAVLAYLMGNVEAWRDFPLQTRLRVEMASEVVEDAADNVIADDNEPDSMDHISNQMHEEQRRNREELLQQIMKQQYDKDALVSELQLKRDMERNKLIEDISNAEATSSQAVDRLLRFRTDARRTDVDLAEREQFELLDQLRVQHADLQRTKVLNEMSAQLGREHDQIAAYETRRDHEHGQLLRDIERDSERMQQAVGQTDVGRNAAIEQLLSDERVQRAAVASLIDRGDGHSWALVEQVRMIEAELVRMTREELTRRQTNADDHMNKLCEQRMDLTSLLVELMDQQDRRKAQLLDNLQRMETEQQDKHQDFWLLQYQKLLDARSTTDDDSAGGALDPRLGYQLLTHDVIHLLPFLSRLLRPAKDVEVLAIGDEQLQTAGIRDAADRKQILRALEAYGDAVEAEHGIPGAAPVSCDRTARRADDDGSVEEESPPPTASSTVDGLAECVVCMERSSNTIFLPCGHLCCCAHCQEPLTVCPMCRASIERRIKVIQA